jgi:epoxyqueuosine reductase
MSAQRERNCTIVPLRFLHPQWVEPAAPSGSWQVSLADLRQMADASDLLLSAVTHAGPFTGLRAAFNRHIDAGHVDGFDWFDHGRAAVAADPRNLHETARSLISVGIPFYTGAVEKPMDEPRGRIARYAWGTDYHRVMKRRMKHVQESLEAAVGRPVEARLLSDTARISDRSVAARAGLGWYGKHSCIIVTGHGSWVMLGELIVDVAIEPSPPMDHDCGRCSICIDRCPTGAIVGPYTVDSPRCLSFQTIEQRGPVPRELRPLLGDWVFGCDICQDVCPYTSAAAVTPDPDFAPRDVDNAFPPLRWLLTMSEEAFRERYRATAVLRAKRRGLARNAAVAAANSADESLVSVLGWAVTHHDEPLVRSHAAWALSRFGNSTAKKALESARRNETDCSVLDELDVALADL